MKSSILYVKKVAVNGLDEAFNSTRTQSCI